MLPDTTQSRRASSRESLNSFGNGFYGPKRQESTPISKQLLAKGQKKDGVSYYGPRREGVPVNDVNYHRSYRPFTSRVDVAVIVASLPSHYYFLDFS